MCKIRQEHECFYTQNVSASFCPKCGVALWFPECNRKNVGRISAQSAEFLFLIFREMRFPDFPVPLSADSEQHSIQAQKPHWKLHTKLPTATKLVAKQRRKICKISISFLNSKSSEKFLVISCQFPDFVADNRQLITENFFVPL